MNDPYIEEDQQNQERSDNFQVIDSTSTQENTGQSTEEIAAASFDAPDITTPPIIEESQKKTIRIEES